MGVSRRHPKIAVPDRRLHEVSRRAAIERVRAVRMSQPVRRDRRRQARPLGCLFNNAVDLGGVESSTLGRAENRIIVRRLSAERNQLAPH